MRRLAWIAAAAAALLAGAAVAPVHAEAQCAFVVVWHDTAYLEYWGRTDAPVVRPDGALRGAVTPGCKDGGVAESASAIPAHRIDGVPPSVAILVYGSVLVAGGYFPQVRGFPIVRTGAPPDDETRGCALGAAVRLTGPVRVGIGVIA